MTAPAFTVKTEFPRFDAASLPELPAGFSDSSWHDDVCPSFQDSERGLQVFIDYVDPEEREFQKSKRFRLQRLNEHGEIVDHVMASDDWAEILKTIENVDIARAFRDILKEQATPAQWEKMRADNAVEPASYICHSHDFCDANMAMIEAFGRVLGSFDGKNIDRMNHVWNFAKAAYLSEEPK